MARWVLTALLLLLPLSLSAAEIPTAALRYRRPLTAEARLVWGLTAPIATFAAQIHQESGWNPSARSAYASGLAQFTPATAQWISAAYPSLAANQPFEPAWALRALVQYDRFLFERLQGATPCDQWAFILAAYNGGEGNVRKDQVLTQQAHGDTTRWWGAVEYFSRRSAAAFTENRTYPRRILLLLQPTYLTWGSGVDCSAVRSS